MRNLFSLKKLLILSCIACASLTLQAQTIRTNYRSEGIMHISTDYEPLQLGSVSSLARVELVPERETGARRANRSAFRHAAPHG